MTAIVAQCDAGGVGWPRRVEFFSAGGRYYGGSDLSDFDWTSIGLDHPARDGIGGVVADGQGLGVSLDVLEPGACEACETTSAYAMLEARGHQITVTHAEQNLGD